MILLEIEEIRNIFEDLGILFFEQAESFSAI